MLLHGIGISNYRSFGPELELIGPFDKVNIFIGQNNSGKSNILRFLHHHLTPVLTAISEGGDKNGDFDLFDEHLGSTTSNRYVALGIPATSETVQILLEGRRFEHEISKNDVEQYLLQLLKSSTMTLGTNLSWFRYDMSRPRTVQSRHSSIVSGLENDPALNTNQWSDLYAKLKQIGGGDLKTHWVPATIEAISPTHLEWPTVFLIPAIRQVATADDGTNDYSGLGIIKRLAQYQHPEPEQPEERLLFDQINDFLKLVLNNVSAELEIPDKRETILVNMDGKRLPLESLGTGVHEVIILATAATVLKDSIVCIEEPELHLHPTLQRRLMQYLASDTSNQYFITTHSAHLIDTPKASVFHVRLEDGCTKVTAVQSNSHRVGICTDLGYKASDLLQANSIIWVEGPTDRIYINHWIRAYLEQENPNLELFEGLHYSIMFYGGRLLSHLSADEKEIADFISLRRLNQHLAIVIDSDRKTLGGRINTTKKRVEKEFNTGPGFAWVTKGREIENYIPQDLMLDAVQDVHHNATHLASPDDQYAHAFMYHVSSDTKPKSADKVKLAHSLEAREAVLDHLDLRTQMRRLVDFILDANGLADGG